MTVAGSRGRLPVRAIDLACAVLLCLGAVRLFGVVLQSPLIGYANQYDMVRTSACVDLWPALPSPERYGAHQIAPVERYVAETLPGGPCYPSTVVAFVTLAKAVAGAADALHLRDAGTFPLRLVGIVQALALAASVLWFCMLERRRPWARLAHAAVFALVLADPINALWLNTLYTEPGALLCAYVAIGLAVLPAARVSRWPVIVAAVAAAAGLAWSRQQYAPFAVVPLLVLMPYWWHRKRAACAVAAMVLMATWVLQPWALSRLPAIAAANAHDFYLGAALPAVRDEAGALRALGLPANCRDAIGSTWYVGMGRDPQSQCPAVARLGRTAFLALAWHDPMLPWRILLRGLPQAQVGWMHYLGMVAGGRFVDLSHEHGLAAASIATVIEALPLDAYFALLAAFAAAFAISTVAWARGLAGNPDDDGWLRAMALTGATGAYALASAIFGDGYVEVARHALLMHAALASLALLCGGRGWRWLRSAPLRAAAGASPRRLVTNLAPVMIGVALAAALAASLSLAARRWPLAHGVLGMPATREFAGAVLDVRGWAVDPFGIATVQVAAYRDWDDRHPAASWDASFAGPVYGPLGESLARYFPTFRDAAHGSFELRIARSAWPAAAPCLRTRVLNGAGVWTEIDRRCMER
jgi:hypothetical protein